VAEPVQNVVALANERMSIIEACNLLGMDISDFSISSLKTYCPFGNVMHADEGRGKALRIYPNTNSAWCFDCQIYFTPVKMIAMDRDITEVAAANWILESTNYVAPDYLSRWEALTAPESTKLNTDDLGQTLKVFCARKIPNWEERQFEEPYASTLQKCLGLLVKVKTAEDAEKWSTVTKQAMSQIGAET